MSKGRWRCTVKTKKDALDAFAAAVRLHPLLAAAAAGPPLTHLTGPPLTHLFGSGAGAPPES